MTPVFVVKGRPPGPEKFADALRRLGLTATVEAQHMGWRARIHGLRANPKELWDSGVYVSAVGFTQLQAIQALAAALDSRSFYHNGRLITFPVLLPVEAMDAADWKFEG